MKKTILILTITIVAALAFAVPAQAQQATAAQYKIEQHGGKYTKMLGHDWPIIFGDLTHDNTTDPALVPALTRGMAAYLNYWEHASAPAGSASCFQMFVDAMSLSSSYWAEVCYQISNLVDNKPCNIKLAKKDTSLVTLWEGRAIKALQEFVNS